LATIGRVLRAIVIMQLSFGLLARAGPMV